MPTRKLWEYAEYRACNFVCDRGALAKESEQHCEGFIKKSIGMDGSDDER
jgi:hypothetical protein